MHARTLQQTGAGIGHEEEVDQFAECYIGSEGPTAATSGTARNLWGELLLGVINKYANFRKSKLNVNFHSFHVCIDSFALGQM